MILSRVPTGKSELSDVLPINVMVYIAVLFLYLPYDYVPMNFSYVSIFVCTSGVE